jgi:hypothetical protein
VTHREATGIRERRLGRVWANGSRIREQEIEAVRELFGHRSGNVTVSPAGVGAGDGPGASPSGGNPEVSQASADSSGEGGQ